METYGYSGKILYVDLSTGEIKTKDIDPDMAKRFIGGIGINMRLAYDSLKRGIDPLSPDNIIVIGAGPFVGTRLSSTSRCSILTKYPLTGAVAYADCGMGFSRRIKYAGYDHVVITGQAEKPVYLKVSDDDNVEKCDAKHLWGKGILDTTDTLWDKYGKAYSVISIGQAGENHVKLALALVDKISTAGKAGLGAVMGSKNLKAIIANGTKRVKVADQEKFRDVIEHMPTARKLDPKYGDYMGDPDAIKKFGKFPMAEEWVKKSGGVPYKNWTELYPVEEYTKRYGMEVILNKFKRSPAGCPGCPHPCKDIWEITQGEYKGLEVPTSSFVGKINDLGIRCGVDSAEGTLKLHEVINQYGVDSHEFSRATELAIELYERGIITKEDTEGLVLKRDFDTTVRLIEQVTFRQGIGVTLGDGSLGVIRRFGKECEKYSCHIKGLSAQNEPRAIGFTIDSFCQVVNPEGGVGEVAHSGGFRVEEGFSQEPVKAYCEQVINVPKEVVDRILDVPYGYNVARLLPYPENFFIMLNSLGICCLRTILYDYDTIAELYSAATGMKMSATELKEAAERNWNMLKVLNVREGFSRKDDRVPPRWLEPMKTASGEDMPLIGCEGKVLTASDLYRLLDDYYDERGWELERGIPSREKLTSLGLLDVVKDLENLGIFSTL